MPEEQTSQLWARSRHFLGGYVSGMALVLAGHPFDTIKVRVQKEGGTGKFSGPMNCFKETVRNEGLRGLYKGVTPPLFATGIINSVLFGMQNSIVHETARDPTNATPLEIGRAAVLSGAVISVLVTPMEGIKSRLQVQYNSGKPGQYNSPIHAIKEVVRTLGVRNGLYRGWLSCAFCRMSNYSYFGSYAIIRKYLSPEGGKMGLGSSVLAGGSAGICYWLTCYPMDVVKNRIMSAPDTNPPLYRNTRDCFTQIYKNEGMKGFFRGFTPCLLRAFPANAACFLTYEVVMQLLPE